jgi:succinate dehydrogenase / fumarate reductase iron-sulfur subunit
MAGTQQDIVTARIYRFNSLDGQPARYDTYQIKSSHAMTVLMILRHIFRNLDRTLAFRDFECYRGVCLSCMMVVKGERVRACSTIVEPGEEITIEPLPGYPLIKDLVVSFD